jgi:hypothetical protein
VTSLDHRNPPTDLWSGPAADLAAAAGASFTPAEPAHSEPVQPRPQLPTDRIAPAPFDELIDTEPSRHVAAAHATSYGVEQLPDDYAYYPPTDGAHSAHGRANRDTRVGPAADRRTAAAAARDHTPATAAGSSGDRGDNGKGRRGNGGKGDRPKRSRAAIGAAVVAGTAMVGTFAFILTNGGSPDPQAGGSPDSGRDTTVASAKPSNPPPAAPGTAKADRKPAVPKPATVKTTSAGKTPNTGAESPKFHKGQWIAVLDTYPTDAGMAADQLAKSKAAELITAGVPARAMLADGQYPGIVDGGQPTTATWIVYVGPATSSVNAMNVCVSPKVQKFYPDNACPTYEPATALD